MWWVLGTVMEGQDIYAKGVCGSFKMNSRPREGTTGEKEDRGVKEGVWNGSPTGDSTSVGTVGRQAVHRAARGEMRRPQPESPPGLPGAPAPHQNREGVELVNSKVLQG